jgi:hypothetical protein
MQGQEDLFVFGLEEIIVIVAVVLLSLTLLITFVLMARRLKRIKNVLIFFQRLENQKPENWVQVHCKNCHNEFMISKGSKEAEKGKAICPKCKFLNQMRSK